MFLTSPATIGTGLTLITRCLRSGLLEPYRIGWTLRIRLRTVRRRRRRRRKSSGYKGHVNAFETCLRPETRACLLSFLTFCTSRYP